MSKKKLLVLGGKPIGSYELVDAAKSLGHYVIVTDYLPKAESPAKRIADESWDISTGDIDALKAACRETGVDGVLAGVHEFNLQKMALLAEELGMPCYCTVAQQELCEDKEAFKNACRVHGLEVARAYSEDEAMELPEDAYPLAIKPRDGSGSRGFTKCLSKDDLLEAIARAKENSFCNEALIEEFIQSDALIAEYTGHQGEVYFCGLTDKHSRVMGNGGAPIMALQAAPARCTQDFLEKADPLIREMLRDLGMTEGPIWLEIFLVGDRFVVNEAGYRFGGSLTYHLVRELYGINQMKLLIDHALGEHDGVVIPRRVFDGDYIIWPLHLHAGKIAAIEGLEWLRSQPEFVALAQVHWVGDEISNWGSAQQVFAYLHLKGESLAWLINKMRDVLDNISVMSDSGEDMLFALFDPNDGRQDNEKPNFLAEDLLEGR